METVEMVVYFVVALIIGGLIIIFVSGIDPENLFKSLRSMAFPQKELKYQNIESSELALIAYNLWENCGLGMQEASLTLYVRAGPVINKSMLFGTYKKLNLCDSIQSINQSCGKREDLIMNKGFFASPTLIKISCDPTNKTLIIS